MASSITHRPPLATLPLSHFASSSSSSLLPPPSPISLPSKRSAPASPGTSRKVSRTEKSGTAGSSSRRGSAEITPVVKKRLERDDLGTGKSPARRLFESEGSARSGVSGSVPTPSSSQPTTLAPSPPLLPRTLSAPPLTETDDNGVIRSIHDPGFPIHPDDPSTSTSTSISFHTSTGPATPKSRRSNSSTPVEEFFPPTPSSASSTRSARLDDQENIPLLFSTPSSTRSSPRKWNTLKSGSSSAASSYEEEETIVFGSGTGLGRNGRSKLVQVVLRQASDPLDEEEDGEELTPGKKGVDPRGKERLAREADTA